MADAVHRNLPFLHSFQQSGLGTGGGTVQFVRKKQIAQHRTGLIGHSTGSLIQYAVARHIAG